MAATKHYDFQEIGTGAVDWPAVHNDMKDKVEAGRTLKATAAVLLSQYDVVYFSADTTASLANEAVRPHGIWQSGDTTASAEGFLQISGYMEDSSWNWTVGSLIYSDSTGALTETQGAFPIAYAFDTTAIAILPTLAEPDTIAGVTDTTDATVTTLIAKTLTQGKTYLVEASVVARDGTVTDSASYIRRASVYRSTGGSATQDGTTVDVYTQESDASWDCDIDVNSNDVRVRITGDATNTVKWKGKLKLVEV